MFKKTTITIVIAGEQIKRFAMRCFELDGKHVVVLGEDHDDHDVWLAKDSTIELIGTLKKSALKRAHECDLMKKAKFGPQDFGFLQPHYRDFEFEGKRVSMRVLSHEYDYHEVCKCGKHMSEPTEPCACKLRIPMLALA